MNHYRSIDQLRGLACLMVVCHHIHHPTLSFGWLPLDLRQGWAGVHIFFVISGFVVTRSLLMRLHFEGPSWSDRLRDNAGRLLDFYRRRFLRLAPAALSVLLLTGLMFAAFDFAEPVALTTSQRLWEIGRAVAAYLIPVYNLIIVDQGFSVANRLTIAPYWTLAIENQFYLMIPLFLLLLSRRRTIMVSSVTLACTIALLVRPLFHLFYPEDTPDIITKYYANSLTNFDGLFVGVFVASVFDRVRRSPHPRRFHGAWVLVGFAIAWIYPNLWGTTSDRGRNVMNVYLVEVVLAALMVWNCARSEAQGLLPFKSERLNRVLDYLGTRSYALYLLHMPIAKLAKLGIGLDGSRLVLAYPALLLVSTEILYSQVERRFRVQPHNFGSGSKPVPG